MKPFCGIRVITHGGSRILVPCFRQFVKDDLVHVQVELVGEHKAVGQHVGQFIADVVVIERRHFGDPLVALQQLGSLDTDGFGEIFGRMEPISIALPHELQDSADGGWLD